MRRLLLLTATCALGPPLAQAGGLYACRIDMECAGVWTECARADRPASMDAPPDLGPVTVAISDTSIVFENVSPGSGASAISAAGIDPGTGVYGVLTYLDGRLGVVLSTDTEGEGLYYGTSSFAGTCERVE
ncbi:MAG: hypothetical protein AAF822_14610 [Pseudomonadota bacterium]